MNDSDSNSCACGFAIKLEKQATEKNINVIIRVSIDLSINLSISVYISIYISLCILKYRLELSYWMFCVSH